MNTTPRSNPSLVRPCDPCDGRGFVLHGWCVCRATDPLDCECTVDCAACDGWGYVASRHACTACWAEARRLVRAWRYGLCAECAPEPA